MNAPEATGFLVCLYCLDVVGVVELERVPFLRMVAHPARTTVSAPDVAGQGDPDVIARRINALLEPTADLPLCPGSGRPIRALEGPE